MPALAKVERVTGTMINTSSRSLQASSNWASSRKKRSVKTSSTGVPVPDSESSEQWRDTISTITTDYLHAEECRGIAQEMVLSLNRGEADTGPGWYKKTFQALSDRLKRDKTSLLFTIWWGHKDPMVPRKAQVWLNRLIEKTPGMKLKTHDIADADHTELLWSEEGMPKVFAMFHFRERVCYGA